MTDALRTEGIRKGTRTTVPTLQSRISFKTHALVFSDFAVPRAEAISCLEQRAFQPFFGEATLACLCRERGTPNAVKEAPNENN